MAKFKIGDKVRILKYSGTVFEKRAMVGKICEIKDVDEESIPVEYKVWQPDKRDHWFFSETELAQVAKRGRPKKDASCMTGTSKPSEFNKLREEIYQTRDMLSDLSSQFLEFKETAETNICSLGYEVGRLTEIKAEEKKFELTDAEKQLLEMIPKKYKWLARNCNGNLNAFTNRPIKRISIKYNYWCETCYNDSRNLKMFNEYFQFIQWSDSEPYEIAKLLEERS